MSDLHHYETGDRVVYTRHETGACPPAEAYEVRPSRGGETSSYLLDEHGEVVETRPDGLLLVRLQDGEQRLLAMSDPRLRRASLTERLMRMRLFPRAG